MRVSVAMTTYNGEKHLKEQLMSFLEQTRLPDELVVSDDSSNDKTIEILNKFKEKASFEVKININQTNIGFTKNFEKAINLCTGDLIFISDHDDVWYKNKIEKMTEYISSDEKAYMAMNDCEIADSKMNPTGLSKINQVVNYQGTIEGFIPGCCSVIRSKYKSLLFPFSEKMSYDSWISFIGINTNSRIILKETLQLYRRYETNTTNHPVNSVYKIPIWKRYFKDLLKFFSTKRNMEKRDYYLDKINAANELLTRINSLEEKTEESDFKENLKRMKKNLLNNADRFEVIDELLALPIFTKFIKSFFKLIDGKILIKDLLFVNF